MTITFDGNTATLQQHIIETENAGRILLELKAIKNDAGIVSYAAEVDGLAWFHAESMHNAFILFDMMKEHLAEYKRYIKVEA